MAAPKVRGIAQVNRAFKAAPKVVQDQLSGVNRTTAESIKTRAQANVPVRYGIARDHIATTFSKTTGVAKVGIAAGRVVVGTVSVNPSKYARLVHNGTSHSKAHPFMAHAVRAEQQPHLERIRQKRAAIERGIAGAAGGSD